MNKGMQNKLMIGAAAVVVLAIVYSKTSSDPVPPAVDVEEQLPATEEIDQAPSDDRGEQPMIEQEGQPLSYSGEDESTLSVLGPRGDDIPIIPTNAGPNGSTILKFMMQTPVGPLFGGMTVPGPSWNGGPVTIGFWEPGEGNIGDPPNTHGRAEILPIPGGSEHVRVAFPKWDDDPGFGIGGPGIGNICVMISATSAQEMKVSGSTVCIGGGITGSDGCELKACGKVQ